MGVHGVCSASVCIRVSKNNGNLAGSAGSRWNRSDFHPKPCLQIRKNGELDGFTGKLIRFFPSREPARSRFY
jgi:hypothetical protein